MPHLQPVTNGQYEIHQWRIGLGKLLPVLAAELADFKAIALKPFDGIGMDPPSRMTARAKGLKATGT